MRREQIVTGITTGLLPAAATAGMLVGFGIHLGAAGRVFQTLGAIVLGGRAYATNPSSTTAVGVLLHILVMLACGVLYASLIGEGHEHRAAWAITVGATVVVAAFVSARTFAGSIALVLTPGNLVAIGAAIAITLPIGMRFAPPRV